MKVQHVIPASDARQGIWESERRYSGLVCEQARSQEDFAFSFCPNGYSKAAVRANNEGVALMTSTLLVPNEVSDVALDSSYVIVAAGNVQDAQFRFGFRSGREFALHLFTGS